LLQTLVGASIGTLLGVPLSKTATRLNCQEPNRLGASLSVRFHSMQARADNHERLRAELAALKRERHEWKPNLHLGPNIRPTSLALSDFYDRLDTYFGRPTSAAHAVVEEARLRACNSHEPGGIASLSAVGPANSDVTSFPRARQKRPTTLRLECPRHLHRKRGAYQVGD
jgi:hypothetical protein